MTAALPPDPAEVTEGDRAKSAELLDRTLHPGVVRDYLPLGERIAAALAAERAAVTRPVLALAEELEAESAKLNEDAIGMEAKGWPDTADLWREKAAERWHMADRIRAAVAAALGETGGGQ